MSRETHTDPDAPAFPAPEQGDGPDQITLIKQILDELRTISERLDCLGKYLANRL